MIQRLLHCYAARWAFLVMAIGYALAIFAIRRATMLPKRLRGMFQRNPIP
jgi:hypothetical protein